MRIPFAQTFLPVAMLLLLMPAACDAPHPQANALFRPLAANAVANPTAEQSRVTTMLQARSLSVQLVTVNVDALRQDKITLSLQPNETVEAVRDPKVRASNGSWAGTVAGGGGEAIFTVRDNKITGIIRNGADVYELHPSDNGVHVIGKIDLSRLPPEHAPGSAARGGRTSLPPVLKAPTDFDPITVLVGYTDAAAAQAGDVAALIDNAITQANQTYANSNITYGNSYVGLSLAGVMRVDYTEAGKAYADMIWDLAAGTAPGLIPLHAQRDQNGADVVVLLVANDAQCGEAKTTMATAVTAYALVNPKCATDNISFAHEIGHLQGAGHDAASDPDPVPFPYGHGYLHVHPPYWRTVMANKDSCGSPSCPRVPVWSNPDGHWPLITGPLTGIAGQADNARVLRETAATVAAFRPLPPPQAEFCRFVGNPAYFSCGFVRAGVFDNEDIITKPWSLGGLDPGYNETPIAYLVDVNNDGRPDYCRLVGQPATKFVSCALQTADVFGQYDISSPPAYHIGNDTMPRLMGDVNGDGRADFCRFVSDGNGGPLFFSCGLASAAGFGNFDVSASPNMDPGIRGLPTAVVDANGDGKADYCRFVGSPDVYPSCTLSSGNAFDGGEVYSQPPYNSGQPPFDLGYDNMPRFFADANGDGLTDYCRFVGTPMFLSCARGGVGGRAFWFGVYDINASATLDQGYANMPRYMVDVNGDGKADYCRFVGDAPTIHLACALSNGTSFSDGTSAQPGFDPGDSSRFQFLSAITSRQNGAR